ncbi:TrkH family potassium uptake protein [Amphibacillus indicireducens]|uniref:Ktr system potassium transporter KtrD n=1 Tax=Amphibacillus indicireducens TaxID=1076330 RepID=A0ABP7W2Q3_9BACI
MSFINRLIKNQNLSPVKLIVLFYFLAILISTAILNVPLFWQEGQTLSLFDSLFTAISAISVTGLSVIPIDQVFNTAGYFALSFIFQLGGIGIMTMGTAIYLMLGKKIGIRERQLISIDHNQATFSGLVRLTKKILQTILVIELVGMVVLSIHYLNYFDTWQEAWLQGYFASVSATTNAGFHITGVSLIPFADDYFVQFIQIILMILGAIGFPVLIEIQQWLIDRKNRKKGFRFTTFMKLTTTTYFLLLIFGMVIIFLIEHNLAFADQPWYQSLLSSLFNSVSTRSGGQITSNIAEFSTPTLIVLAFLMFIGASPSSAGGGIRTTTFAVMLLSVYNYAKGRQSIKVFQREISHRDTIRSFVVLTTAISLTLIAIFVLSITESFSILELAFEVFSAFGTTGLSLGITAELSVIGRIVIMVMMFIGRIGIFSFLFLISSPPTKDLYRYPEARMLIG